MSNNNNNITETDIPLSVFTKGPKKEKNKAKESKYALSPAPNLKRIPTLNLSPRGSGSTEDVLDMLERGKQREENLSPLEKKMNEILTCLEGTIEPSAQGHRYEVDDEDKVVDLWHLRHLSLSRGGLISPTIRKRAWPKLVGVDEHILTTTSASIPSPFSSAGFTSNVSDPNEKSSKEEENENEVEATVELTNKDIKLIKQDIGRCAWHVEYHIKMLRKRREKSKIGERHVGKEVNNDTDLSLGDFSSFGNTNASTKSNFPMPGIGVSMKSPESADVEAPTLQEEDNGLQQSVSLTSTKPSFRSKREMGLIMNIITAVLRSVPEGENESSRLHYFQGLHDVAALFLINLESPSLTSLVMKRICHFHFRDAMRPNFQKVQVILQAAIMPLLETVDKPLHDYILQGGTDDSSVFALSWIITWFAHDVHNFDVVSRLFDVFLVSHPLFPAYLSVATLTLPSNRAQIMSTNCEFSALYEILCNIPKNMTSNNEDVMDLFEDLIELALKYMRELPPRELVDLARGYRGGYLRNCMVMVPQVFTLEDPPRWSIAPTAPTDWSLIKLAKLMRGLNPQSRLARRRCLRLRHFVECTNLTSHTHEIALVAFGLDTNTIETHQRKYLRLSTSNGLVAILLLAGTLYCNERYRGPSIVSRFFRSDSIVHMYVPGRSSGKKIISYPKLPPDEELLLKEANEMQRKEDSGTTTTSEMPEWQQSIISSPEVPVEILSESDEVVIGQAAEEAVQSSYTIDQVHSVEEEVAIASRLSSSDHGDKFELDTMKSESLERKGLSLVEGGKNVLKDTSTNFPSVELTETNKITIPLPERSGESSLSMLTDSDVIQMNKDAKAPARVSLESTSIDLIIEKQPTILPDAISGKLTSVEMDSELLGGKELSQTGGGSEVEEASEEMDSGQMTKIKQISFSLREKTGDAADSGEDKSLYQAQEGEKERVRTSAISSTDSIIENHTIIPSPDGTVSNFLSESTGPKILEQKDKRKGKESEKEYEEIFLVNPNDQVEETGNVIVSEENKPEVIQLNESEKERTIVSSISFSNQMQEIEQAVISSPEAVAGFGSEALESELSLTKEPKKAGDGEKEYEVTAEIYSSDEVTKVPNRDVDSEKEYKTTAEIHPSDELKESKGAVIPSPKISYTVNESKVVSTLLPLDLASRTNQNVIPLDGMEVIDTELAQALDRGERIATEVNPTEKVSNEFISGEIDFDDRFIPAINVFLSGLLTERKEGIIPSQHETDGFVTAWKAYTMHELEDNGDFQIDEIDSFVVKHTSMSAVSKVVENDDDSALGLTQGISKVKQNVSGFLSHVVSVLRWFIQNDSVLFL